MNLLFICLFELQDILLALLSGFALQLLLVLCEYALLCAMGCKEPYILYTRPSSLALTRVTQRLTEEMPYRGYADGGGHCEVVACRASMFGAPASRRNAAPKIGPRSERSPSFGPLAMDARHDQRLRAFGGLASRMLGSAEPCMTRNRNRVEKACKRVRKPQNLKPTADVQTPATCSYGEPFEVNVPDACHPVPRFPRLPFGCSLRICQ